MNWKTLSKIDIRGRDKEVESFTIQHDGDFYRIQNEFGNISFEFDVSSGYSLAEELISITQKDIENEIVTFLNDQDSNGTDDSPQVDMFSNNKKYAKLSNAKNGLKITFNGGDDIKTDLDG